MMKKLLWLIFALFASPLFAQPQFEATLSTTTCPGSGCIVLNVIGQGSAGIQIVGALSGTLQFEQASDSAGTYTTWAVYPNGSTSTVTSATAAGLWAGPTAGARFVRVRFSSYTSGTPTVSLVSAMARVMPPTGSATAGGTCTNQAVTAIAGTTAAPTCTTLTSAYVDSTIALTGTDVNTSNQVTATHLASALPVAQGGTALATLTAHALYVGNGTSAPTAVAVCGTGTYVRGAAAADPICSTLVLPNAATQGDLLAATSSNTVGVVAAVAAGSLLRSAGTSTVPAYTTATFPATATAGQYLIATTTNAFIAVQPALAQAQPADQTARSSSASFVMMGLGAAAAPCTITPVATGRVKFEINGDLVNNTTATTVTIQMAESTGTAPANNAAASGTLITQPKVIDGLTSDLTAAFHLTGTKTGLGLGTAVWFDIQLKTSSTNTGQPTNVDCVASEI